MAAAPKRGGWQHHLAPDASSHVAGQCPSVAFIAARFAVSIPLARVIAALNGMGENHD
jgi:hypothetical protein